MSGDDRSDSGFGMAEFAVRCVAALALVLLTYNPTSYSFVGWLRSSVAAGQVGALHALAGVALLIGWTFFLRTTWESFGTLGVALASLFLGALVWVLVDFDLLDIDSGSALIWVVLVCVAVLLAIGMAWGHVKRRASGQVAVDDIER